MDRRRSAPHRRLITLTLVLLAVLVVAIAITGHTMRQRQQLSAHYRTALGLAAHSATLRTGSSELFTWQIAGALGVLERRPDAVAATDPARVHYQASMHTLERTLDHLAAGELTTGERRRVEIARAELAELQAIDARVVDDYLSGDEARVRDAARASMTTEIDQFQVVSQALTTVATALEDRAGRVGEETEELGVRVQLLVLSLAGIMIVALLGVVVWVWRDGRRSHEAIDRLRLEANLDPLTGIANRRLWDHALGEEMRRGALTGRPFTVVLLDLDHFKRFNDTHGHPAGDRHLRAVADACTATVRRTDLVARLGGEEFGLLLPGSVAADARRVVEQLRPRVPGGETFSAGLAEWNGSESAAELVARADHALYAAKTSGRDRLQLAST